LNTEAYAFRAKFADSLSRGVVITATRDTLLAHWDSIRHIPPDIKDGDSIGITGIRANYSTWLRDSITFVNGSFINITQSGDSIKIAALVSTLSCWDIHADTLDTTIVTNGIWGILKKSSEGFGRFQFSHVNIGVECTTGATELDSRYNTIGGGLHNSAIFDYTTVAGGYLNKSAGDFSSILGGFNNYAKSPLTTIGGGAGNFVEGEGSVISGGQSNLIEYSSSVIAGGTNNQALANYSTISGGDNNIINSIHSNISGGEIIQSTPGSLL
jgi:hypothetical protein